MIFRARAALLSSTWLNMDCTSARSVPAQTGKLEVEIQALVRYIIAFVLVSAVVVGLGLLLQLVY